MRKSSDPAAPRVTRIPRGLLVDNPCTNAPRPAAPYTHHPVVHSRPNFTRHQSTSNPRARTASDQPTSPSVHSFHSTYYCYSSINQCSLLKEAPGERALLGIRSAGLTGRLSLQSISFQVDAEGSTVGLRTAAW